MELMIIYFVWKYGKVTDVIRIPTFKDRMVTSCAQNQVDKKYPTSTHGIQITHSIPQIQISVGFLIILRAENHGSMYVIGLDNLVSPTQ